jgi:beta-lactamase class C
LRGSAWRRERVSSAGYALGWRVYDYAGHQPVFHGGAVQGYRGLVALLPESDLGIAILWNSESSLPSGMLPTILDRALGLPPQRWLDVEPVDELLYAERDSTPAGNARTATTSVGSDASAATAAPK